MIIAICLLGAVVVFLAIVVAVLYFQIIRPMQMERENRTTAIPSEQVEAVSKRADEIAHASAMKHLDVREDLILLSRRVDELETIVQERPTLVSP